MEPTPGTQELEDLTNYGITDALLRGEEGVPMADLPEWYQASVQAGELASEIEKNDVSLRQQAEKFLDNTWKAWSREHPGTPPVMSDVYQRAAALLLQAHRITVSRTRLIGLEGARGTKRSRDPKSELIDAKEEPPPTQPYAPNYPTNLHQEHQPVAMATLDVERLPR